MNKMGFELSINGKKYLVKCDTSIITNTSERDTSNKVNLRIRVFEDGEFIKLDRDSYVAEKITDFIRNCINGQDNVYWDWDEPNRHLDKPKQYLKWEDLATTKTYKCLLNGNEYIVNYYSPQECDPYWRVRLISPNRGVFIILKENYDKQFFNDLHLEVIKEYDSE